MRHPPPRLVLPIEPAESLDPAEGDQLLDGLRAQRAWAERVALEKFTPHVRRVLVRILGSTAEVEDLTQEVFLRGLDRIGELREGVSLKSWFASFAVHVAREMLRT